MSEAPPSAEPGSPPIGGGDFRMFLARLGIQGLMSLGQVDNPATGQRHVNLEHARMLVADLEMLRAKTEGNLDEEERGALAKVLGDMQQHLLVIERELAED